MKKSQLHSIKPARMPSNLSARSIRYKLVNIKKKQNTATYSKEIEIKKRKKEEEEEQGWILEDSDDDNVTIQFIVVGGLSFLNCSCSHHSNIHPCEYDGDEDLGMHQWQKAFAAKPIQIGEELVLDYGNDTNKEGYQLECVACSNACYDDKQNRKQIREMFKSLKEMKSAKTAHFKENIPPNIKTQVLKDSSSTSKKQKVTHVINTVEDTQLIGE